MTSFWRSCVYLLCLENNPIESYVSSTGARNEEKRLAELRKRKQYQQPGKETHNSRAPEHL